MRIERISIENFRNFENFHLKTFGRVNLLVGENNCGKTSILEAISIVAANGDPSPIWSTLYRRGEDIYMDAESVLKGLARQADIRRLFRNHEIVSGKSFNLSADTNSGSIAMSAKIEEFVSAKVGDLSQSHPMLFDLEPQSLEAEDFFPPLMLGLTWSSGSRKPKEVNIPISRRGGIAVESARRTSSRFAWESAPVRFINASSLTSESVSAMFEDIVLTPEEDLVTDAMRIIEPNIERIASAGAEKVRMSRYPIRGGILVRLKGAKDRVPIGSMGDGLWRLLGIALTVVQLRNGIVLIDEIDTGLHHSVLKKMWHFLNGCAKSYNIQIIATTHSWDCYHSLAAICRENVSEGSEVTISRIERGRSEAITYTEQEIIAAAEHDIEVR